MREGVSLSRPLDARQLKTRAALHAAVLALAREKSFDLVSVSEIAQVAGIGPATFYRHYSDKQALLADVADNFVDELLAKAAPLLIKTDSRAAALAVCKFVEAREAICRALLVGASIQQLVITRAMRSAETNDIAATLWPPGNLGRLHLISATLTLIEWWLIDGRELSSEEMSLVLERLVFAPTLTLPGGG